MPSFLTMLNINNLRFLHHPEHPATQALLLTFKAYHTRTAMSTKKSQYYFRYIIAHQGNVCDVTSHRPTAKLTLVVLSAGASVTPTLTMQTILLPFPAVKRQGYP